MNAIYRVVWSAASQDWVVAAETASSQGKTKNCVKKGSGPAKEVGLLDRPILRTLAALVFLALGAMPAVAQTVPDATNLTTLAAPVASDTWNFLGDATLFNVGTANTSILLPTSGLFTISGVSTGSTIALNDGAGHYGYFAGAGGATSTTLTLSNLTITGGNNPSVYGGAISVNAGNLVLNTDVTGTPTVKFDNNTTANHGGAIYVGDGVLTVNGDIEASNNSGTGGSDGGAFYGKKGVSITGSAIMKNNVANTGGGAIAADAGGVNLSGNTINLTNNQGVHGGGAIFSANGGAVTLGNSASSVTLAGNYADDGVPGTQVGGSGGAIDATGTGATVAVKGSSISITDNRGYGQGGAIFADAGVTVDVYGTFHAAGNAANNAHGGVIYTTNGDVSVDGHAAGNSITFDNNQALNGGGAVVAQAGAVFVGTTQGSVTLTRNHAADGGALWAVTGVSVGNKDAAVLIGGSNTTGNSSSGNAGAIRVTGNQANSVTGYVTINGSSVTVGHNTASGSGGAIYNDSGATSIAAHAGDVTVSNNTSGGGGNDGGAIHSGGATTLTGANVTVAQNNGGWAGGAIYSGGATTLTGTTNVTVDHNATGWAGGAIYSLGATTLKGTKVALTDNTAGNGGAIYTGNGNATTIDGALAATDNQATNGTGGVIFATGSVVAASGGVTLTGNTATSDAGAIFANRDVSLATTSGDVSIANNQAGGSGGAIRTSLNGASTNNVSIGNGSGMVSIAHNTAGSDGGAISTDSAASVTIKGSSVSLNHNSAVGVGGAIHTTGATTLTGTNVTVDYNTNEGWAGGAIYSDGATTLSGTTVTVGHNTTQGWAGGAIYSGGATTLTGTTVILDHNTNVGWVGGAIYSGGATTLTGAVSLTSNTAENGGAIYTGNGNATTINGDLIATNNQATGGTGGVLYASGQALAASGNVTLTGNTATGDAGAIFANSDVSLATTSGNVSIANNQAGGSGGAIQTSLNGPSTSNVSIGNGSGTLAITGNQSLNDGGAISANGDVLLTAGSGILNVSDNHSLNGKGGAIQARVSGVPSANVTIKNSGAVNIGNNTAASNGGAIQAEGTTTINGSAISLVSNSAGGTAYGGAISSSGATTLTGATVMLTGNTAGTGGAIYTGNSQDTTVNGVLDATNNQATANPMSSNSAGSGGAIFTTGKMSAANGGVTLTGNTATGDAGAIFANSDVSLATTSGNVSITNNQAGGSGGAILTSQYLTATNNVSIGNSSGTVNIAHNVAGSNGGAVFTDDDGSVTITGTSVSLENNAAQGGNGGAIFSSGSTTLTGTTVSGNTASGSGGAIYTLGDFTLKATTADLFSNNTATGGQGGAIWAGGDVGLNANGGDITFRNNKASGLANAIYLDNTSGGKSITFNAPSGRTIAFYDPIENNAANGLVTAAKTGAGMLSFDGSLYSTAADRWSKIYGLTYIDAGTFEVANNAVYGVQAATVGQAQDSRFTTAPGTTVQGGVAGTVIADQIGLGDNSTLNIAGRQPGTRGTFTLQGNSLALGAGSRVLFNTELNDATIQNTDLLVLNQLAATGTANFVVNNVGGLGALTVGDGIKLVNVVNGAVTSPETFRLSGRVVAGIHEYDLYRGGVDANANDGNWYLRSIRLPQSTPTYESPRPEPYLYAKNQEVARGMFVHTLHDRLGEPQYTDAYRDPNKAPKDDKVTVGWARIVGSHADSRSAQGRVDLDTDTVLIHFGGDVARWNDAGDNRYQLGLMGAYGKSDTKAADNDVPYANNDLRRQAKGSVEGYSVGAYGTWYGNGKKPEGPYIDAWALYGWYSNTVKGSALAQENYHSHGWTVSVEGGYAFIVRENDTRQWMLEPQVQVAYNAYSEGGRREENGTRVDEGKANGLITRLGTRFYRRGKQGDNGAQPFVEANWWHSDAASSLSFNGESICDGTPADRYELKLGMQGEVKKNWQLWGHLGSQWGKDNYNRYEAMAGLKHVF